MAAFLKLEGVDGQSPDDKHTKWIEIQSFSNNMMQTGAFGKDGSLTNSTVSLSEFSFQKEMDVATPTICEKLATGAKIDKCVVHFVAATGGNDSFVYAKYEFTPCIVAAYSVGGGTSAKPTESISIRFQTMRWEYTTYDEQTGGNTVRSGWDSGKNIKDTSNVSE